MTNFRLFQTKRVCIWQFQIWWKWQKVLQTGWKHCGKWRNCLLRAISPFPSVFSKYLCCRHINTRERVKPKSTGWVYAAFQGQFLAKQQIFTLVQPKCDKIDEFFCVSLGRKHSGKRRKCCLPAFSPFPILFSTASLAKPVKLSHKCTKLENRRSLIWYPARPTFFEDSFLSQNCALFWQQLCGNRPLAWNEYCAIPW